MPEISLPDLGEHYPMLTTKLAMDLPPKKVFDPNAPERNLWRDDGFYNYPGNHDPIYLSADKKKIDLITLVHRVAPSKAPYENREWWRYCREGGRRYSGDTEYLIHPLTAFFFARWLDKREFLSPANLSSVFSPHAEAMVSKALYNYREADPICYNFDMIDACGKTEGRKLMIHVGKIEKCGRFKLSKDHGAQLLHPEVLAQLLKSSMVPCDASDVIERASGHPPFYKPGMVMPLWQQVYIQFGYRITKVLADTERLESGCFGCGHTERCDFSLAR